MREGKHVSNPEIECEFGATLEQYESGWRGKTYTNFQCQYIYQDYIHLLPPFRRQCISIVTKRLYTLFSASSVKISPETDKWIRYGRDLSISCIFSSKHYNSIQLLHGDNEVHVSDQVTLTSETFTDADDLQTTVLRYTKSNVKFDDAGIYECRTENAKKQVKIDVVKG